MQGRNWSAGRRTSRPLEPPRNHQSKDSALANVTVIGGQWGDEGKGKIVDWLASRADVVARVQGGHNAGHTLVVGNQTYKLSLLPELYGGAEVLEIAEKRLPRVGEVTQALKTLRALAKACPVPVSFDLAELRGYHYHSGVVFDAYCAGVTGPVARGGRYDEVGKAFGRARPATGFSIDLRAVAGVVK